MGQKWIQRFMQRHPDLHVRWTSSLEECRARALTPDVVGMSYSCSCSNRIRLSVIVF